MILLQCPTHTLAQDFEIDPRTGFIPPIIPISRLPSQWEAWECALDDLKATRLQLGSKSNLTVEDTSASEAWRARIREVCTSSDG
jgi:indoleamine 2,3-dioxygenase